MNETVCCTVGEVTELMAHLDEDDMVILTIINRGLDICHSEPRKIRKRCGEKMLLGAKTIEYQDNDFFGRFTFIRDSNENIINNILFPQMA